VTLGPVILCWLVSDWLIAKSQSSKSALATIFCNCLLSQAVLTAALTATISHGYRAEIGAGHGGAGGLVLVLLAFACQLPRLLYDGPGRRSDAGQRPAPNGG